MTEYAVSTNLISWVSARAENPLFGWPQSGPEAEVVKRMLPGDVLIPKFSQNPEYRRGAGQKEYQQGVCEVLGSDPEEQLAAYGERVAWGEGAVPFLMRVTGKLPDDDRFPSDSPWTCVAVEVEGLPHPLSTREFLLLLTSLVAAGSSAHAARFIMRLARSLRSSTLGRTSPFRSRRRRLALVVRSLEVHVARICTAELAAV